MGEGLGGISKLLLADGASYVFRRRILSELRTSAVNAGCHGRCPLTPCVGYGLTASGALIHSTLKIHKRTGVSSAPTQNPHDKTKPL